MFKPMISRGVLWIRNGGVAGGLICLLGSSVLAADAPKTAPAPAPRAPAAAPAPATPAPPAPRDTEKARDAAKDVRDTAKDARDTAKDTAKDARDTAKDVRDSAKDTAKDARDTTKDTRDTAKDPRDTRDTAKDPRDTRDTKDTRDAVRDNVRDTTRDVRDGVKDTVRDVRDTAKDVRDTAKDVRNGVREGAREGRRLSADQWGVSFGKVTERGLPVTKLTTSSVAYRAGLRESDVILSINGHTLRAGDDFERYVYDGNRTERVKIIVWRGGREEIVYLEPNVIYVDSDANVDNYADDYRYFGVDVDDRVNDRIVIRKVYPDSPAYASGLRDGDVITTWHGERVATPRDFGRIIQRVEPGTLKFEYSRDSKTLPGEVKFSTRPGRAGVREERREERREAAPIRNR